jgi:hypothetical protein
MTALTQLLMIGLTIKSLIEEDKIMKSGCNIVIIPFIKYMNIALYSNSTMFR